MLTLSLELFGAGSRTKKKKKKKKKKRKDMITFILFYFFTLAAATFIYSHIKTDRDGARTSSWETRPAVFRWLLNAKVLDSYFAGDFLRSTLRRTFNTSGSNSNYCWIFRGLARGTLLPQNRWRTITSTMTINLTLSRGNCLGILNRELFRLICLKC